MKNHKTKETFKALSFIFALVCQEANPWNVIFTLLPVTLPIVLFGIHYIWDTLNPYSPAELEYEEEQFFLQSKSRVFYNKKLIGLGTFLGFVAFIFFAKGLDEERDWLRISHSLWHLFVGLSGYAFLKSRIVMKHSKKSKEP